jgi:hypothetical protein
VIVTSRTSGADSRVLLGADRKIVKAGLRTRNKCQYAEDSKYCRNMIKLNVNKVRYPEDVGGSLGMVFLPRRGSLLLMTLARLGLGGTIAPVPAALRFLFLPLTWQRPRTTNPPAPVH